MEWWAAGEPCEDDGLGFCGRCKPRQLPDRLYMTHGGGSSAFHDRPDCRALRDGQRRVDRRGGTTAPVVPMTPKQAATSGKFPCLECFPHLVGRL